MAYWGAIASAAVKMIETYGSSDVTKSTASSSTQKVMSKEAMDKIVSDVLGSEKGLASIAQGENTAGLYGSATESLLTQRLVTETAGMLANITAPTVQTQESHTKKKKKLSIICTTLVHAGKLDRSLYLAGQAHFNSLPLKMVEGYLLWATPIARKIRKNPSSLLAKVWLQIAKAHYLQVTGTQSSFLGLFTIYGIQPVCYVIGSFLPQNKEALNGIRT